MAQNESNWTLKENTVIINGKLDGKVADEILASLSSENIYIFDFSGVTDINFAALRTLLRCRKSGQHFSIINAESAVAEKFEDTGVSAFINICRKAKPLDMSKYEEFGASFLSKAYNSQDGDSMMKVYGDNVPKWLVAQEKVTARAVMQFGIPTPLVGTIYEDGARTALDFERIEGKKSFSRIISEQPERLEEISVRFAKMCKQLHSTECDTSIFANRATFYRDAILRCPEFTEEEKAKALDFVDNIPNETTCLHGDMQLSNVITSGKEDLWIDLSDFGYGNHMLDMGMWYFQCFLVPEGHTENLFHLNKEQMGRIWNCYIEEYFGADTDDKKAEVNRSIVPFAALHMLYLGSTYEFLPFMIPYIRENLMK